MTRREFISRGIVLAGASAFASPVRSVVGGRHSQYVPTSQTSYTAVDYVTDGLLAQWDGIENIGYGIHDDETEIWIDLARPDATEWFNVGTDTVWDGNSLILSRDHLVGNGYLHNYLGTYYSSVDWAQASFEYCFSCAEVTTSVGNMITLTNNAGGPLRVINPWNFLRVRTNGNGQYGRDPTDSFSLLPYVGGQLNGTFSISPNGLSFNGVLVKPTCVSNMSSSPDFRYGFNIGSLGGSETRLHSVRVYSHALSPDEVFFNWKLDSARFGI